MTGTKIAKHIKSSEWIARLQILQESRLAFIGGILILVIIFVSILAPFLAPYNPLEMHMQETFSPPSFKYLLGTDEYGRDMLSRVIYGSRISILVATLSTLIAFTLGIIIGAVAGYFGGKTDNLLMRFMDAIFAFPAILLAIALISVMGKSLFSLFLAIGIRWIPNFARITRGQILQEREKEYVQAAIIQGESKLFIIFCHILPNCISPLLVLASNCFAVAILVESALSFLGLGVAPPTPSWGLMLSEARGFMETDPYTSIFPGLAIMVTVLALNFFGDGLRDIFDPRTRV